MKTQKRIIGDYTATIDRDDRGRIVAEVWHNASGKTVGITEVDTVEGGWHWAKNLIGMQPQSDEATAAYQESNAAPNSDQPN